MAGRKKATSAVKEDKERDETDKVFTSIKNETLTGANTILQELFRDVQTQAKEKEKKSEQAQTQLSQSVFESGFGKLTDFKLVLFDSFFFFLKKSNFSIK